MCILNLQINRFFCFANLQGVITVLFRVGGTNSVCAELIPTCMDGDDGTGECERMGDDDGGETGQKEFVKVWVVMRRQRGQVNMHFCASHFLALSLCPSVGCPTAESLSVFNRNSVPTLNIKKCTMIFGKSKMKHTDKKRQLLYH